MKSPFKLLKGPTFTILTLFLFSSCKTYPDYLVFNKSNFEGKEIYDTIEAFPERGIYILSLEEPGFLGNFSWNLGLVKTDKNNTMNSIKYETEIRNKTCRISKDYIAYADIHTSEWGWFYLKNGKIADSLPLITKFIDSIKSISPKNIFIREKNGYVEALLNGETFQLHNYEDFIIKDKPVNYDSLDLGLYSIQKNKLIIISRDPNMLLKQHEGLFLVPYPGYNLLAKFRKEEILNAIEKTFNIKTFLNKIIAKGIDN